MFWWFNPDFHAGARRKNHVRVVQLFYPFGGAMGCYNIWPFFRRASSPDFRPWHIARWLWRSGKLLHGSSRNLPSSLRRRETVAKASKLVTGDRRKYSGMELYNGEVVTAFRFPGQNRPDSKWDPRENVQSDLVKTWNNLTDWQNNRWPYLIFAGTWILRPESVSVTCNSLFIELWMLQDRQSPCLMSMWFWRFELLE